MTHRVVISRAIADLLAEPEVRENFTIAQSTEIDRIRNGAQPCADSDFRYLLRRLAQAYCTED